MATKPQVKVAIDNTVVQVKADIDNVLPVGVNIIDGNITFGPIHWVLILDAGGVYNTAKILAQTLISNLNTVGRSYTLERFRRSEDGTQIIIILTQLATYRIINIGTTSGEVL